VIRRSGPALPFQELPEEPCGRSPVASRLDQDVNHVTVLVDGAPQILLSSLDRQEELVQIPGVAHPASSGPKRPRILSAEGPTPLSDRLVGDGDSSLSEQIFSIPKAQTEAMVEPHRVPDNLGWESVSVVIRGGEAVHRPIAGCRLNLTMPWLGLRRCNNDRV
jgi:hypothetical protein